MSDKTILVIDDSATIRKLVDTHLSPVGYQVVLAPNAEEGLQLAEEIVPDLILLDHQLPGTTGYDVCCQLVQLPKVSQIPVVVSSTLRKKAYAEYIDLDNVVDMLPKPYTEELLRTTVANALETAAMIVSSQSQGTAVPETIGQQDEAALTGSLSCFGIRELVDFLNNGRKQGVLEIEADRTRIRIHLGRGRIQGVYASGMASADVEAMIERLPASLASLAPVLKLTIAGRSCAEVDGFVQLLDQKVLDPRLMSRLLRFQAAMLMHFAFGKKLSAFRFESGAGANTLHRNLPLDISLLALLVEGAVHGGSEMPPSEGYVTFVRQAIRGQNLDRAGLSARHMKLVGALSEPKTAEQIAEQLGWNHDEVIQVLHGFQMAELVEQRRSAVAGQFVVFETDAHVAQQLRTSLEDSDGRYVGKVVRDKLALQLVLKRNVPHTLVFRGDDDTSCELIGKLFETANPNAGSVKRVAMVPGAEHNTVDWQSRLGFVPDAVIDHPCGADKLFETFDQILADTDSQQMPTGAPIEHTADPVSATPVGAEV